MRCIFIIFMRGMFIIEGKKQLKDSFENFLIKSEPDYADAGNSASVRDPFECDEVKHHRGYIIQIFLFHVGNSSWCGM